MNMTYCPVSSLHTENATEEVAKVLLPDGLAQGPKVAQFEKDFH